ncbi:hypothetical protein X975_10422, partial [Stegodyphus mimosarum]
YQAIIFPPLTGYLSTHTRKCLSSE